jgi:hypothetical protein
MTGRIEGGWEYVIAAYVVSLAILAGYAVSVFVRHRREQARRAARPPVTTP